VASTQSDVTLLFWVVLVQYFQTVANVVAHSWRCRLRDIPVCATYRFLMNSDSFTQHIVDSKRGGNTPEMIVRDRPAGMYKLMGYPRTDENPSEKYACHTENRYGYHFRSAAATVEYEPS